jgi:putative ABC transport system permease protein
LTSLLFDVNPIDAVTYIGVAIVLGLAGLFAVFWPARRAARVDPVTALRYE